MAQLDSAFNFTGRLGNLTAYKLKGSDKIVLRARGGPGKEKIEKDPCFEKTRQNNAEFGGCGKHTKFLRKATFPMQLLADYNFSPRLNALAKHLQILDTTNEPGKRSICMSKYPSLLAGFNFNRKNNFDSIVRNPLSYQLDKNNLTASIDFPAMIPEINFFIPPPGYSAYSFVAVLGIGADLVYAKHGYTPSNNIVSVIGGTEWYPSVKGSPAISVDLNLAATMAGERPVLPFSLLLSVGICWGEIGMNKEIVQVKKAGAGKILGIE